MTTASNAITEHARAILSLSPWVPLLAVAIIFLVAGVDIASGLGVDSAIFGHSFLALFGLGLLATLLVRGRRRPMGHVCFGLAALQSVGVVIWSWGYIPTTRGMVLASVAMGALYVSGLLFYRAATPSGIDLEHEGRESRTWSMACVLSLVAAVFAWGMVAASYAHTAEIRWPLTAWGAVFAVLPFVSRAGMPRIETPASSLLAIALPLVLALVANSAKADPPYTDGFDAPDTIDGAVLIAPGAYRAFYEVVLHDFDYYRFTVSDGQDISISCTQFADADLDAFRYPCTIRLIDPAGFDRSSDISSDGVSTHLSVNGAAAGDWRLEASGYDVYGTWVTFCCQTATYLFSVELTPAPAVDGAADRGPSGGSLGHAASLLFAALVLFRRRRSVGKLAVMGVLSLLSFGAAAQTAAPEKPIQPGAPKYVHGGRTQGTPIGVCTMNFVFTDGIDTYIGSAGHCTLTVGERETAPEIGEFGTVAFRVSCNIQALPDSCPRSGPPTDDFALIRVDADKLDMVSPIMRGVGAMPAGFTVAEETAQGDLITVHGQGAPFNLVPIPATRTQTALLVSDDATFYESTIIGLTDSGSPVWHNASGKALGIVTTFGSYGGASGPTLERIMALLSEAGIDVALAVDAEGEVEAAVAQKGGGLGAALLLPLGLLALRRARASIVAVALLLSACSGGVDSGPGAGPPGVALDQMCQSIGGGLARMISSTTGSSHCPADSAGCPPDEFHAAIDGDYRSFALLHGPASNPAYTGETVINVWAQPGVVFAAGQSAGALIQVPHGDATLSSHFQMSVATYLEGVPQNVGLAVAKLITATDPITPSGEAGQYVAFYGIETSSPYDEVELYFDQASLLCPDGCDDVRIYEICTR